jgi:hypothetical protein
MISELLHPWKINGLDLFLEFLCPWQINELDLPSVHQDLSKYYNHDPNQVLDQKLWLPKVLEPPLAQGHLTAKRSHLPSGTLSSCAQSLDLSSSLSRFYSHRASNTPTLKVLTMIPYRDCAKSNGPRVVCLTNLVELTMPTCMGVNTPPYDVLDSMVLTLIIQQSISSYAFVVVGVPYQHLLGQSLMPRRHYA